jgi:Glyoxalase-like domain
MPLPIPTLDHVVINVRDQIDAGAVAFRRLGFTLTPRGYHTLGSMNHLAMFGSDYLELIAAPPGDTRRPDVLGTPFGLNGLVFGTEDSAAVHAALAEAGVPSGPPLEFSRPVMLDDGSSGDATFRTVTLAPGTVAAGRVYFCHHFTRHLVWRDEWRHHANGAIAVARAVIASRDPSVSGGVFARMFGADAVREVPGGCSLAVGMSRFDLLTHEALVNQFGEAAPGGDGRAEFMAALSFRTRSLDAAFAALEAGGVDGFWREERRVVVPAASAFGCALEFWA